METGHPSTRAVTSGSGNRALPCCLIRRIRGITITSYYLDVCEAGRGEDYSTAYASALRRDISNICHDNGVLAEMTTCATPNDFILNAALPTICLLAFSHAHRWGRKRRVLRNNILQDRWYTGIIIIIIIINNKAK